PESDEVEAVTVPVIKIESDSEPAPLNVAVKSDVPASKPEVKAEIPVSPKAEIKANPLSAISNAQAEEPEVNVSDETPTPTSPKAEVPVSKPEVKSSTVNPVQTS